MYIYICIYIYIYMYINVCILILFVYIYIYTIYIFRLHGKPASSPEIPGVSWSKRHEYGGMPGWSQWNVEIPRKKNLGFVKRRCFLYIRGMGWHGIHGGVRFVMGYPHFSSILRTFHCNPSSGVAPENFGHLEKPQSKVESHDLKKTKWFRVYQGWMVSCWLHRSWLRCNWIDCWWGGSIGGWPCPAARGGLCDLFKPFHDSLAQVWSTRGSKSRRVGWFGSSKFINPPTNLLRMMVDFLPGFTDQNMVILLEINQHVHAFYID